MCKIYLNPLYIWLIQIISLAMGHVKPHSSMQVQTNDGFAKTKTISISVGVSETLLMKSEWIFRRYSQCHSLQIYMHTVHTLLNIFDSKPLFVFCMMWRKPRNSIQQQQYWNHQNFHNSSVLFGQFHLNFFLYSPVIQYPGQLLR